jgi:hypothetical protein
LSPLPNQMRSLGHRPEPCTRYARIRTRGRSPAACKRSGRPVSHEEVLVLALDGSSSSCRWPSPAGQCSRPTARNAQACVTERPDVGKNRRTACPDPRISGSASRLGRTGSGPPDAHLHPRHPPAVDLALRHRPQLIGPASEGIQRQTSSACGRSTPGLLMPGLPGDEFVEQQIFLPTHPRPARMSTATIPGSAWKRLQSAGGNFAQRDLPLGILGSHSEGARLA